MSDKVRIYGDVSQKNESDFLLIKGVYGCKSNGETLEKMIETVIPIARKEASKKSSHA